jgi:hypothetical protein
VENTAQTVNTIAPVLELATDAVKNIVKNRSVGYNIAYNTTLLKSVNYLKPLGFGLSAISFGTDLNKSVNGKQSWTETGLNTTVSVVAIIVGGWEGFIIQTNYQASKLYMKTLMEHPEWAPYPIHGR